MAKYKTITRADAGNTKPGYWKAWFSLLPDFVELKTPISTANIGDKFIIADSHEWVTGSEPIECYISMHSLEADGDSIADPECQRMLWKPKVVFIGDFAAQLEMQESLLNERIILFMMDDESPGNYIQFGNAIATCILPKTSFKSGNLKSGGKYYATEMECFCRYFYQGVIPADSAITSQLLNDNGSVLLNDDGTPLSW